MNLSTLFSIHYWRHILWLERTRKLRARHKQPVHANGIWFRKYWVNKQLKGPLQRNKQIGT